MKHDENINKVTLERNCASDYRWNKSLKLLTSKSILMFHKKKEHCISIAVIA
jgi:hypothetical protein